VLSGGAGGSVTSRPRSRIRGIVGSASDYEVE
jgi:hypothetical protein